MPVSRERVLVRTMVAEWPASSQVSFKALPRADKPCLRQKVAGQLLFGTGAAQSLEPGLVRELLLHLRKATRHPSQSAERGVRTSRRTLASESASIHRM